MRTRYEAFRRNWLTLGLYQRFEQVVLLVALLALARKFIILDATKYSAGTILALAAVLLALGVTYWLVRDQDRRHASR